MSEEFCQELCTYESVINDNKFDVSIIDLTNSVVGTEFFLNNLKNNINVETNLLLIPTFGNPISPYISVNAQVEICNLLTTYKTLLRKDFENDELNIIFKNAKFPVRYGYIFSSYIAVNELYKEICNLNLFSAQCPELLSLFTENNNNIICDLTITFENIVIILRCIH